MSDKPKDDRMPPEEHGRGDPVPEPLTDEKVYAEIAPADPRMTSVGRTEEEEAEAAKAAKAPTVSGAASVGGSTKASTPTTKGSTA